MSTTYTEKVGNKLNELLEKSYDAEKGYHKAAENAKSPDLKGYFERKSKERNQFGHALKSEIRNYGQEVDKGGSAAGSMHRAWMDVKAFFSADNDESMLEAAITGEKAAVDDYEDVLKETNLPPSTATLLTSQVSQIKNDLATIKSLEDLA
ncbi:PA2169 family four-helix-bundle protein [Aureibaculum sp. 2210JD6-5]|uniref:ferritin-like domain-containing protein n=1 Tax=Aureibaculum sp. 2210JD6-5 TaxID=3103957 RepID=UPI002AAC6780|nr:PA2169 family four-helix-bundle protein [Aureibaculum sp. 2210JD6-5]MDY7394983.1 PA2169 family four-helix-bundle protein [Aureibaculum sp. 2210JD6-5]